MLKFNLGLQPRAFKDYFILNSSVHNANTRGKNNFYLPRFRTSFMQRNSIKYQGPVHWNCANQLLKAQNLRVHTFKKMHKNLVFGKY